MKESGVMKETGIIKGFFSYLQTQMKRYMRNLPVIAAVVLLIFLAVGAVAYSYMHTRMNSEEYSLASVGIVGDLEGSYLGIGIMAIESLDPSRNTIDFVSMTQEEADKALSDGTIQIYIIIPDNFIEDISAGKNVKLTMVGRGSKGIGAMLIYELSKVVSVYIDSSETAIYAVQYLAQDKGVPDALGKIADDFFMLETKVLFSRDDVVKLSLLGVGEGTSMTGYYFCGISILFFMLTGIAFCDCFLRQKKEICRVLASRNVGASLQVAAEYICFTFVTIMLVAVLVGIASIVLGITGYELPLWSKMPKEAKWLSDVQILWILFAKWIPVIIMITSLQFLIFELTQSVVSSVLTQFLTAAVLGYASGLFYPIGFFPTAFQKMTAFLPTRLAFAYCQNTLLWENKPFLCGFMMLYTFAFWGIAYLARKYRLKK